MSAEKKKMTNLQRSSIPIRKLSKQRPGLTEDQVAELKEAFDVFDTEGKGTIDPRELRVSMQNLGFHSKNPNMFRMIADLEKRSTGAIGFEYRIVLTV